MRTIADFTVITFKHELNLGGHANTSNTEKSIKKCLAPNFRFLWVHYGFWAMFFKSVYNFTCCTILGIFVSKS